MEYIKRGELLQARMLYFHTGKGSNCYRKLIRINAKESEKMHKLLPLSKQMADYDEGPFVAAGIIQEKKRRSLPPCWGFPCLVQRSMMTREITPGTLLADASEARRGIRRMPETQVVTPI